MLECLGELRRTPEGSAHRREVDCTFRGEHLLAGTRRRSPVALKALDRRAVGVLGNPDMISDDGVHPNAAGARYIAGTIWEYLEPMAKKLLEGDRLSSTTLDKR